MNSLWRQSTTLLLSLWIGSFTFYAAIVVPIGTEVLGKTSQGFVTQQVAYWINGFSLVIVAFLLADLLRQHGACRICLASFFALQTCTLVFLHGKLSGYLSFQGLGVAEPEVFYEWHRGYLIVSSLQWATAIASVALLIRESAIDSTN